MIIIQLVNIPLSFITPKNSDRFFGKINLTKSNVEYLPLNIYKPSKMELAFDYGATLKDNIVYIDKFNSLVDYLNFDLNGFIDLEEKVQEIDIQNI